MLKGTRALVILVMMAALLTWSAPAALAQDAGTVLANASKAMGALHVNNAAIKLQTRVP